jgi:hypothetical protein
MIMKKMLWLLTVVFCLIFCVSDFLEAAEYTTYKNGITLLDGKIKFGGRFRYRQEFKYDYYITDPQVKVDDDLSLFQSRLYVEYRPVTDLVFHLMFEDARDSTEPHPYKPLVPYAYDTPVDVQQAYVSYEPENQPFSVWAGRREVSYLKHRLIGTTIGWGNKVWTYDGFMATLKHDKLSLDLAYLNWVKPQPSRNTFEHAWFDSERDTFVAWFTAKEAFSGGNIDFYTIIDNSDSGDDIYIYGIRGYGKVKGFNYDINGTLELGDKIVGTDSLDRVAWAAYIDAWYAFDTELKPTLGIEYFVASGDDDPYDNDFNTFDQLYGTPHYDYGYMDLFGWQNMHDLNVKASIVPFKDLKVSTSLHTFWLFANEDNWYNAYKNVQRAGNKDARRFVGNELDVIFFYNFLKYYTLIGTYGHFFTGDFVEDTGHSNDADFFSMELRFEF